MSDWEVITRKDAVAALEQAMADAADEVRASLEAEGFSEAQLALGMHKVSVALEQARQRSMASIDRAFTGGKAAH